MADTDDTQPLAENGGSGKRPVLSLIAGPNGAGKSTLYKTQISETARGPFLNADVVQRDELRDASLGASYEAARIVRERQADHLQRGASFVTETVFSHSSKNQLVRDAKAHGFKVALYHVDIRDADLSVSRVANRVAEGGHDVPPDKARARYHRNKPLIREAMREADQGFVFDNSVYGRPPRLLMRFRGGRVVEAAPDIPGWGRDLYRDDLRAFAAGREAAREADAARETASLQQLARTARDLLGAGAELSSARGSNSSERGDGGRDQAGAIVAESTSHILERADDGYLVAHGKEDLARVPPVGGEVRIAYPETEAEAGTEAATEAATEAKAEADVMARRGERMSFSDAKAVLARHGAAAREVFASERDRAAGLDAAGLDNSASHRRAQALLQALDAAPGLLDGLAGGAAGSAAGSAVGSVVGSAAGALVLRGRAGGTPAEQVRQVLVATAEAFRSRAIQGQATQGQTGGDSGAARAQSPSPGEPQALEPPGDGRDL